MLLNTNFFFLKNYYHNLILSNIKFILILLFYIKMPFFNKLTNSLFIHGITNIINIFYTLILKITNLNFIKLLLIYNNKYNLSKIGLPKKYTLTTVLKSPHTDKRSREQFHIIKYNSFLKYPLFYSIYNSAFLHSFFLFERGFNVVLKTKTLV